MSIELCNMKSSESLGVDLISLKLSWKKNKKEMKHKVKNLVSPISTRFHIFWIVSYSDLDQHRNIFASKTAFYLNIQNSHKHNYEENFERPNYVKKGIAHMKGL